MSSEPKTDSAALRADLDILHRWTFGSEGEWDKATARRLVDGVSALLTAPRVSPSGLDAGVVLAALDGILEPYTLHRATELSTLRVRVRKLRDHVAQHVGEPQVTPTEDDREALSRAWNEGWEACEAELMRGSLTVSERGNPYSVRRTASPVVPQDDDDDVPDWFVKHLGDMNVDSEGDDLHRRAITLLEVLGPFIVRDIAAEAWLLARTASPVVPQAVTLDLDAIEKLASWQNRRSVKYADDAREAWRSATSGEHARTLEDLSARHSDSADTIRALLAEVRRLSGEVGS
jgi:hypothetical protein